MKHEHLGSKDNAFSRRKLLTGAKNLGILAGLAVSGVTLYDRFFRNDPHDPWANTSSSPSNPDATKEQPATPTRNIEVPPAGTVLYETTNFEGWQASGPWKIVDGNLLNDGSKTYGSFILAPFNPPGSNYCVEISAKALSTSAFPILGVVARVEKEGGYSATISNWATIGDLETNSIIGSSYSGVITNTDWLTIKLEVLGSSLNFYVNGQPIISTGDAKYTDPGKTGIFAGWASNQIRSFKVTQL